MPELPEVEAVTRKTRAAVGAEIVSAEMFRPGMVSPQKPAFLKRQVSGRSVESVERRGKNILVHLSGDKSLRVHLRMTGNLVVIPDSRFRPVTARLWFTLADGRALILDDPRALGRVTIHARSELPFLFRNLGPEPFSPEFTIEHLIREAKRTPKPAKILLMDQKAVAGLGNIYAAEALFQARIHPAKPSRDLSRNKLTALHTAIVETLRIALDSAIAAYESPGGFGEGELFPVSVYGREGEACPACGRTIRRIPQGGRSTYYCPGCQR